MDSYCKKVIIVHEKLLIENFISKHRQERYNNLIQTKKGRIKLRSYIAHFEDFDNQFLLEENHLQTHQQLYTLLKSKGAGQICYIISEHSDYDGRSIPLLEATTELFNSGIAFFLSCIPGKLIYYEGEGTHRKFLLLK